MSSTQSRVVIGRCMVNVSMVSSKLKLMVYCINGLMDNDYYLLWVQSRDYYLY